MTSMADTYILASKARAKLTRAASQPDHDLRVLVSHANLLDNLMERIQSHRESIIDGSYISKSVTFNLPSITHVSLIDEDDDDYYDSDSDSDGEDDDESFYYKATQVSFHDSEGYDDDDAEDSDSLSDFSDDDSSDEEGLHELERTPSKSFRKMPTIEEMSESELEELRSASEEDEVDITDLRRTPSLVYSTTEDSESEDDEDELHTVHDTHHTEYTPSEKNDTIQHAPAAHGNLLLESLEREPFDTPAPGVLCS